MVGSFFFAFQCHRLQETLNFVCKHYDECFSHSCLKALSVYSFVTREGSRNRLVEVNREDAWQDVVHFSRYLDDFLGNHGQRWIIYRYRYRRWRWEKSEAIWKKNTTAWQFWHFYKQAEKTKNEKNAGKKEPFIDKNIL